METKAVGYPSIDWLYELVGQIHVLLRRRAQGVPPTSMEGQARATVASGLMSTLAGRGEGAAWLYGHLPPRRQVPSHPHV